MRTYIDRYRYIITHIGLTRYVWIDRHTYIHIYSIYGYICLFMTYIGLTRYLWIDRHRYTDIIFTLTSTAALYKQMHTYIYMDTYLYIVTYIGLTRFVWIDRHTYIYI